jgi:hypothetical protein
MHEMNPIWLPLDELSAVCLSIRNAFLICEGRRAQCQITIAPVTVAADSNPRAMVPTRLLADLEVDA